ncbi:hypothetical protein [Fodinicola feengrottensis]|uniref:hypothetical protein n=1 Tax=Fodinicola feengrottensis TaxID=435914 RepID=UPI0013D20304|nr:hypothetical protein [Fodinicola feengrottensis]
MTGGQNFVGINGKARYLRVMGDTPAPLTSMQVVGFWLGQQNLAGGKTYTKTYLDGTVATPSARFPDKGNDSTDGVLAAPGVTAVRTDMSSLLGRRRPSMSPSTLAPRNEWAKYAHTRTRNIPTTVQTCFRSRPAPTAVRSCRAAS